MFNFRGNVLSRTDAQSSSEDVPLFTDTSDGQFLESTLKRRIPADRKDRRPSSVAYPKSACFWVALLLKTWSPSE